MDTQKKEALVKGLIALFAIFVIVISIKKLLLGGSMTLEEYAKKNPEIAYSTPAEDSDEE